MEPGAASAVAIGHRARSGQISRELRKLDVAAGVTAWLVRLVDEVAGAGDAALDVAGVALFPVPACCGHPAQMTGHHAVRP